MNFQRQIPFVLKAVTCCHMMFSGGVLPQILKYHHQNNQPKDEQPQLPAYTRRRHLPGCAQRPACSHCYTASSPLLTEEVAVANEVPYLSQLAPQWPHYSQNRHNQDWHVTHSHRFFPYTNKA